MKSTHWGVLILLKMQANFSKIARSGTQNLWGPPDIWAPIFCIVKKPSRSTNFQLSRQNHEKVTVSYLLMDWGRFNKLSALFIYFFYWSFIYLCTLFNFSPNYQRNCAEVYNLLLSKFHASSIFFWQLLMDAPEEWKLLFETHLILDIQTTFKKRLMKIN